MKNIIFALIALMAITSCTKEDPVNEKQDKIAIDTEIVVDGETVNTRAASEAGYTTGDGLYDKGDNVIVAAYANEGYELVKFYNKKGNADQQDGSTYEFKAETPQTFKAEFAKKYSITVSATPDAGGTVSGGGIFRGGKSCTLTTVANSGYTFDGWYEGSTKVSSLETYSFTVSSNRTLTAKFIDETTEYLPFYVYVANDQAANWDSGIVNVYLDDVLVAQVTAANSGYKGMAMNMPTPELVTLEVPKSDPDEAVFDGWYQDGRKLHADRTFSFYPGQDWYEVKHLMARWISR